MAKLVSVFISAGYRRLIATIIWLVTFALVLAMLSGFLLHKTYETMDAEAAASSAHFERLRSSLLDTFAAMHGSLTAEPCSPAFNEQLRKIAYRPDGFNEFLYAPGGSVLCSTTISRYEKTTDLGRPDLVTRDQDLALWIDQDLGFLGLAGEHGTVALSEPFAIIVPSQNMEVSVPSWMAVQVTLVAPDGRWWHRLGEKGIYSRYLADREAGRSTLPSGYVNRLSCDSEGVHCVASRADLLALAATTPGVIGIAVVMAAAIAWFFASQVNRVITRYWSFESRFRRHLKTGSIVCAYQPVMEVESGQIIGCEVLARWLDVDDRLVMPDRFIDLVEEYGLTQRFTELVVQRAFSELSEAIPAGRRIQVNFNVFPCDVDSAKLLQIFAPFTALPNRFDVVLEIIESDQIPAGAQREIETLRRAGIKTYIDDFGTGYSNMQNLAALSVDGVKLDRAFAMAPDNSMMAQMLRHAVEMIHATGRVMVVEGVETAERLQLLHEMTARVDFVQGYFISRPLDAAAFAAFLAPRSPDVPAIGSEHSVGSVAA